MQLKIDNNKIFIFYTRPNLKLKNAFEAITPEGIGNIFYSIKEWVSFIWKLQIFSSKSSNFLPFYCFPFIFGLKCSLFVNTACFEKFLNLCNYFSRTQSVKVVLSSKSQKWSINAIWGKSKNIHKFSEAGYMHLTYMNNIQKNRNKKNKLVKSWSS